MSIYFCFYFCFCSASAFAAMKDDGGFVYASRLTITAAGHPMLTEREKALREKVYGVFETNAVCLGNGEDEDDNGEEDEDENKDEEKSEQEKKSEERGKKRAREEKRG
ncbi:hypothetical protein MRB53_039427 [Persea americana]|nr:hypothetical protein MRB53_039427 [Persea americana]